MSRSTDNIIFGKRLKECREEKGLTMADVAKIVNLTEATISRYEKGYIEPKGTTIKVLADYFRVSPSWMHGLTADCEKHPPKITDSKKIIPLLSKITMGDAMQIARGGFVNFSSVIGREFVNEDSQEDYTMLVQDNSMEGARIYKNDIAYIKKQTDVENGELAVVVFNGSSAVIKRLFKMNGGIVLHSEKSGCLDISLSKKEISDNNVLIIGKVLAVKTEVN